MFLHVSISFQPLQCNAMQCRVCMQDEFGVLSALHFDQEEKRSGHSKVVNANCQESGEIAPQLLIFVSKLKSTTLY